VISHPRVAAVDSGLFGLVGTESSFFGVRSRNFEAGSPKSGEDKSGEDTDLIEDKWKY
jgi:hypothetical protein